MKQIYKVSLCLCLCLCWLIPAIAQQGAPACNLTNQGGTLSTNSTSLCVGETYPAPILRGNPNVGRIDYILTNPQDVIGQGAGRGPRVLAINSNGVFNLASLGFQDRSQFCITAVSYDLAGFQAIIDETLTGAANTSGSRRCCTEVNELVEFDFCGSIGRAGISSGAEVTSIGQFFEILRAANLETTVERATDLVDNVFNPILLDEDRCVRGLPLCYAATDPLCYTLETCPTCPPAGTACDDNNATTNNDREDGNCNCAGAPCPVLGTVCNDGNPTTNVDREDGNCNCIGTTVGPVTTGGGTTGGGTTGGFITGVSTTGSNTTGGGITGVSTTGNNTTGGGTTGVSTTGSSTTGGGTTGVSTTGSSTTGGGTTAPTAPGQGALACNLTSEGGRLTRTASEICVGDLTPAPKLTDYTAGLERIEYILTDARKTIGEGDARGDQIMAINSSGIFNPLAVGFKSGDRICVTAVGYNLSAIQKIVTETLYGSASEDRLCCQETDAQLGFNFCGAISRAGITDGAQIKSLGDFFRILRQAGQPLTLENLAVLIDDSFNKIGGDLCTAGLPICYASTNTLCYSYGPCINGNGISVALTPGTITRFDPLSGNAPLPSGPTPDGFGSPACGLGSGGTLSNPSPMVCIGQSNAAPQFTARISAYGEAKNFKYDPLLQTTLGKYYNKVELRNTEFIMTNPQDIIGVGVGRGGRIVAVNSSGVFNPSQFGLQDRDIFCVTAVTYDITQLQDIVDETLKSYCCKRVSEELGFDFCGGIQRAGYSSGKQVRSLSDFFRIMEASGQAPSLENIITQIDYNFNQVTGALCTDGLPFCYAATNTVCYSYIDCDRNKVIEGNNIVLSGTGSPACNLSTQGGSITTTSTVVCNGYANASPQLSGVDGSYTITNISKAPSYDPLNTLGKGGIITRINGGLQTTEYVLTNQQNFVGGGSGRGAKIMAVNYTGSFNATSLGLRNGDKYCVTAVTYDLRRIQDIIEETVSSALCCYEVDKALGFDFCGGIKEAGYKSGRQVTGLGDFFRIMAAAGESISLENITAQIDLNFNLVEGDRCTNGLPICYASSNTLCYTVKDCVTCPTAGTACNDGNPNTVNDVEDGNCGCAGQCPTIGTACDDGNPNTFNDVQNGNCNCAGTTCPFIGNVCSDGDRNTINDTVDANCNCVGTPKPICNDVDNDDICDDVDPCVGVVDALGLCNGGCPSDDNNNGICDLAENIPVSPCDATIIQGGNNNINISRVDGVIVSIAIFDVKGKVVYSCWNNQCQSITTVPVGYGKYTVLVQYFSDSYASICRSSTPITISNGVVSSTPSTGRSRISQEELVEKHEAMIEKMIAQETNKDAYYDLSQIDKEFPQTNYDRKKEVQVYPNPTSQELNIVLSPYVGQHGQLQMFNNLGQQFNKTTIQDINSDAITMNVSDLDAGLYFLQLVIDGELKEMIKVIVE